MKDFLSVYISKIPPQVTISTVKPESRNIEIQSCKSQIVKEERFWAWKVLETAITENFDFTIENANLIKTEGGKWISDKLNFSLTHSHGLVAVAISTKPVGIDIETWKNFEKKNYRLESMIKKFLSAEELKQYPDACDKRRFLELWTKKEASFKENPADEGFYSKMIELSEDKLYTKYDVLDDIEYCLSVCSILKQEMQIKVI